MGRKVRTKVPCHLAGWAQAKDPRLDHNRKKEREYSRKMKLNYDRRHRVVEGEQLTPGDRVWKQDLKAESTVREKHAAPWSVVYFYFYFITPQSLTAYKRRIIQIRSREILEVERAVQLLKMMLWDPRGTTNKCYNALITSASRPSQEAPRSPLFPDSQAEIDEPAKPCGSSQPDR